MEKIIQINYQERNISIEETAYNAFQQYEDSLKTYFLNEEGGEETFSDLQYRMAEILEERNRVSERAITMEDINELIATIGNPSDLDSAMHDAGTQSTQSSGTEKKKLYRNKNKGEKVIAGVCSGIANYFSIDPIAVRLTFVLFTIFNIATFFSFNVGILAYILLWILLEPANLKTNIHRKLFRNPKDKVLGGVCSGLAQFFNSESWVVRLIFLAPFFMGIVSESWHNNFLGSHHISSFFFSFSFFSYLILWAIIPLAKSPTDYMLLKGEPINISTIQNSTSMSLVTQNSNSGLSKFLKIVAYIILGMFLLFMIPVAITIVIGAALSFNLADIVLFTSFNKIMAVFTLLFLVILPLIGIIIWVIRKVAGYTRPNRPLRILFIGLHILGWASAMILIANLARENNTYVSVPVRHDLNVQTDTLFVKPMIEDSIETRSVVFEVNQFDHLLERTPDRNKIKAVRVHYKQTDEPDFYMEIERSAFGNDRKIAGENAMIAEYDTRIDSNNLFLASHLGVTNKVPYHFQNVKVTIYVPKNKTVIVSDKMKKQLRHSLRTNHKNFEYHFDASGDVEDDEVISFDNSSSGNQVITINDKTIRIDDSDNEEAGREAKREIEEAQRETQIKIEEAQRTLEEANRQAQRDLEEAKRESQRQIEEAQRNLKQAEQDLKRQIEDAERARKK